MSFRTAFCTFLLLACPLASPAVADEADAPTLLPDSTISARTGVQTLLDYAKTHLGIGYKFGGTSPESGFDCSGFVRHVFDQTAGMVLPHNARAISLFGRKIGVAELQPGDLVFYNTLRRTYSHVGIYLGDNRFIHSASRGGGIEIVNMKESYWSKRFNGARRVIAAESLASLIQAGNTPVER